MPLWWTVSDSEPGPFNRSQARNRAVAHAKEKGAKIIVLSDADTIPEAGPLERAIQLTREDGKPRLPYDRYYLLNKAETEKFVAGDWFDLRASWVYPSVSGVSVLSVDWFMDNQYDERYVNWGHEDNDFAARAQFERVSGNVYAMWHTPDERGSATDANLKLYKETYGLD